MTRATLTCLAALAATAPMAAQTVTIDSLRPPVSPAFVLLGTSPSSVQRPGSPHALGLSLLSAFRGNPLDNFALEFAPYWLGSHPALTVTELQNPSFAQTMARTFTLSLATARYEADSAAGLPDGARVGAGARWLLSPGSIRNVDQVNAARDSVRRIQQTCLTRDDTERCLLESEAEIRAQIGLIRAQLRDRVGFIVEAAAGVLVDFQDYRDAEFDRVGAWLSPSYRSPDKPLHAIALLRYSRVGSGEPAAGLFDLGAHLDYKSRVFSLGGEGVARRIAGEVPSDWTYRFAAVVEAQISADLHATYSLARDYEGPGSPTNGGLVSSLSITLGASRIAIPLRE